MTLPLIAAIVLTGLSLAGAAPVEDKIKNLPGLDIQPNFNHYAGYLAASDGKQLFYWFVESEHQPSTDPLVLWLNGGPGCSSLIGFLTENGPWRIKPGGHELEKFEHRWNKIANMLFIESPECVGFSFSNDGKCETDDNQTALDNHLALKSFFVKFPELKNREFFITGESYGGIYVPTLSSRVEDDPDINFKGFAVGNSVTDDSYLINSIEYFYWARGLIGPQRWDKILEYCCMERNASNCEFARGISPECENELMQAKEKLSGLNRYNIYAECYGGVPDTRGVIRETEDTVVFVVPELAADLKRYKQFVREISHTKRAKYRIPCVDTSDIETYLNRGDVRSAIHANAKIEQWEPCSVFNYTETYWTVRPEYLKVLQKGHRIVAYYGDFDSACNHLSGMWFTESLNIAVVEPFQPWFYNDRAGKKQVAGFAIQYKDLKFVSVMASGHMVPTDKPLQAFMLFQKFLTNEMF